MSTLSLLKAASSVAKQLDRDGKTQQFCGKFDTTKTNAGQNRELRDYPLKDLQRHVDAKPGVKQAGLAVKLAGTLDEETMLSILPSLFPETMGLRELTKAAAVVRAVGAGIKYANKEVSKGTATILATAGVKRYRSKKASSVKFLTMAHKRAGK